MKITEINAEKVEILASEVGHLKLELSEAKREIEFAFWSLLSVRDLL